MATKNYIPSLEMMRLVVASPDMLPYDESREDENGGNADANGRHKPTEKQARMSPSRLYRLFGTSSQNPKFTQALWKSIPVDADERYSSVVMGAWGTSQQKSTNTERNCDEGAVANLLGN